MERLDALRKLKELEGIDLHSIARKFEITVLSPQGKVNKGWAGHVCERFLGIPINSAQSPDFGSWELKSIPLKRLKTGQLQFKETMAITMIDPDHVARTRFEDSHLLAKLKRAVCIARVVGNSYNEPSFIHSIVTLDLSDALYQAIKADYEAVQECLNDHTRGFKSLTGKMGVFIQPRTKGRGHGSVSRAFYARKRFLAQFIKLQ